MEVELRLYDERFDLNRNFKMQENLNLPKIYSAVYHNLNAFKWV